MSIDKFELSVQNEYDEIKINAVSVSIPEFDPFKPGSAFMGIIRRALEALKDELPPKDEVLDRVGRFYDQYVAPIDLPGIPNFGPEQIADKVGRALAIAATGQLYDWLMGS